MAIIEGNSLKTNDDAATKKFDFNKKHMLRAIELSRQNLSTLKGGPFDAVLTQQGMVIKDEVKFGF